MGGSQNPELAFAWATMRLQNANNPLEYRAKAVEATERAMTTRDPGMQERWLLIAKSYREIAASLEQLIRIRV